MVNSAAQPTPAERVRGLIRAADRAVLATGQQDMNAWPYASLVLCACDQSGAPMLLISDLAEHTRNLDADSRMSLLYDGTVGHEEPLAGARATLLGRARRACDDACRSRYLARHPSAAGYADFADFHFYRIEVEHAHLVAGFGAIDWVDGADILYDMAGAGALSDAEADIVAHMNQDHADAVESYAQALLALPGGGWLMTGIDPEGIDLRSGGRVARLDFDHPVSGPDAARRALIALVERARARL